MCEWESKKWRRLYRCKIPPEPGSRYCIFHKPDKKDLEKFKKKYYEQIDQVGPEDERNPRYDFTGYVFPEGLTVGRTGWSASSGLVVLPKEIPAGASFDEAVFGGTANFNDVTFKGIGAFSGATFKKIALFRDTTFEGDAKFQATTFNGLAVFSDVTLKKDTAFQGSQATTVDLGPQRPTILWWEKDRKGIEALTRKTRL